MNPWHDPREPRVTREDQARRLRERGADLLGNRFRFRRNGDVRTSPERYATRQEAERARWKMGDGALVSPGVTAGPMRRGNFNELPACPQAVASIGMPGLHCHD